MLLKKRLRYKYGITIQTYEAMRVAQGNKCAICQESCGKLHIDHDHKTGNVRQLLCGACNRGLGNFRDNTLFLIRAMHYLAKWKE